MIKTVIYISKKQVSFHVPFILTTPYYTLKYSFLLFCWYRHPINRALYLLISKKSCSGSMIIITIDSVTMGGGVHLHSNARLYHLSYDSKPFAPFLDDFSIFTWWQKYLHILFILLIFLINRFFHKANNAKFLELDKTFANLYFISFKTATTR